MCYVVSEMMTEMNEQRHSGKQAADFIEFISHDLPWDDIDRALGVSHVPSPPAVVSDHDPCSPAAHDFNPDDLSLFNAFADSLPSLGPHADCDTDIKAISSSVGRIEDATKPHLPPNAAEGDSDCPEEISLSSQMEQIMADILDNSARVHCDGDSETEVRHTLQAADSSSFMDVDNTELSSSMKKTSLEATETAAGDVEDELSSAVLGETAADCSSVVEQQSKTADERVSDGAGCDAALNSSGNVPAVPHDNSTDDDDDEITDSQEWICEQLHKHIAHQHEEASRMNSLRVPPPGGIQLAPRNPVIRALHALVTEDQAIKLNMGLTEALLAGSPDIQRCCKLLDDYNPHHLSPGVLVQYPFFAGTVDASCRWAGVDAELLHTAARRIRAYMLAMYARHSITEDFLSVLNRKVQQYY